MYSLYVLFGGGVALTPKHSAVNYRNVLRVVSGVLPAAAVLVGDAVQLDRQQLPVCSDVLV